MSWPGKLSNWFPVQWHGRAVRAGVAAANLRECHGRLRVHFGGMVKFSPVLPRDRVDKEAGGGRMRCGVAGCPTRGCLFRRALRLVWVRARQWLVERRRVLLAEQLVERKRAGNVPCEHWSLCYRPSRGAEVLSAG